MKSTHTAILILTLASLTTGCVHVTNMATEIYWNTDNPVAVDPDLTLDTLCVVKYAVAERTGQTVIHSQKEIDILLYQFLFDAGVAAVFGPGTVISDSAIKMLELLIEARK